MKKAIFYAILAAALYALNAPVSKLLLQNVPLTMMAGFLYLGAGIGMAVMGLVRSGTGHGKQEMRLTKKDLPRGKVRELTQQEVNYLMMV